MKINKNNPYENLVTILSTKLPWNFVGIINKYITYSAKGYSTFPMSKKKPTTNILNKLIIEKSIYLKANKYRIVLTKKAKNKTVKLNVFKSWNLLGKIIFNITNLIVRNKER